MTASNARSRRPRWEGYVEVCNTCDRLARWPFCEHRPKVAFTELDAPQWYRLVRVREIGRPV